MHSKITCMTYCNELDLLSVGLLNGQVVQFTFDIESFVYSAAQDDGSSNQSPSGVRPPNKRKCNE